MLCKDQVNESCHKFFPKQDKTANCQGSGKFSSFNKLPLKVMTLGESAVCVQ